MTDKPQIRIAFNSHGLGDVIHCCHAMRLYMARGYDVAIQIEPNKQWAWQAAGIPIYHGDPLPIHPYYYPSDFFDLSKPDHTHSKLAHLFEVAELPKLGTKQEVWDAVCDTEIDATHAVSSRAMDDASKFLEGLPHPIILLHSKGTNWQSEKSIPDGTAFQLLRDLLDTGGSVVTLDWDGRSPTLGHDRVRPIKPNWHHISLEEFGALCRLSDLLIGVDSGPFHLAGWFDIPTLYISRKIPPVRCCLPSPNATYLVPAKDHAHWAARDARWRFVEFHGDEATPRDIMYAVSAILNGGTDLVTVTAADLEPIASENKSMPQLLSVDTVAGQYTYNRVGHDERPMELRPDGTIGEGAAGCERTWSIEATPIGQVVALRGNSDRLTCHFQREADGVFRGRWFEHERMPVELAPVMRDTVMPAVELVDYNGILVRTGYANRQDLDVVRDVMYQDSYKLALCPASMANEVVVDIGAHIGTFATMWHRRNPSAKIICVEACPENIPVLKANVGAFATVIHAACTYEPGELALFNSIKPDGTATGGSTVVPQGDLTSGQAVGPLYWPDLRPLRKISLEQIIREYQLDRIDILKMDCEGSEFSILEQSPSIPLVRFMCGEYHGQARWDELLAAKLPGWTYTNLWAAGGLGIFHLTNPATPIDQ